MRCSSLHATVFVVVSTLALHGLWPSAIRAQADAPQVADARSHFEIGRRRYAERDFALAAEEFRVARDLMRQAGHPNAELLSFNLARCLEELGRDHDALTAYEEYLRAASTTDENRADAEQRVRELRARVALTAPRFSPSPVGFVVGGVGVAGMLASILTGSLALVAQSDATAGCVGSRCPVELAPRADEAHMLAIITDVLLLSGIGLTAAGTALIFLLQDGQSAPPTAARVLPLAACDASACVGGVQGAW